eukprot:jgi/Chlat1/4172/Chrsp27S04275
MATAASVGVDPLNTCAHQFDDDAYNLPLHIAAVFVVFGCSFLGCTLPVAGARWPGLQLPPFLFLIGRNFGTGVILATGFIHMLGLALDQLTSPCLPALWNKQYTRFAGAFALVAALAVQLLEFLLTLRLEQVDRRNHERKMKDLVRELDMVESNLPRLTSIDSLAQDVHQPTVPSTSTTTTITSSAAPTLVHRGHAHGAGLAHAIHDKSHHKDGSVSRRRRQIVTLVLEAGIAFHSVIIGMSLGVVTAEFKTLLAAICVHQFFEGFALGATVIDACFDESSRTLQIVVMVLVYALTTPLGIVVGIGVRYTYNSASTTNLYTQGIFNALSGGILIYTGLVELVTYNITMNPEFRAAKLGTKLSGFLSMYIGAGAMSVIGKWA